MIIATKPEAVSKPYEIISYGLGLVATGMAVAQMVSFEEFAQALDDYGVTGEHGAVALGIVLIALEIFSVPFLFRLSLSPLARMVSALFVVLAPCAWMILIVLALSNGATVPNAGFVGGFLEIGVNGLALTLVVAWLTVVGFSFGPLGGHKALKPKLQ